MARIRYLKPDFFKDEDLSEHPYWIRLLFAGLWNIADKEGRLEDREKRIKVDVFPYDNVDIEKGLSELAKIKNHSPRPFIQRYQVNGERYIQIVNWKEHQKPHHTEKESILPAPPLLNTMEMEKGMENQHEASAGLSNGEITVKTHNKRKTIDLESYPHTKDQQFNELMTDFQEARKKIHAPLTDKAIELTLKKLHKYDLPTAKAMIEQSIERGWRGVFEIKQQIDTKQPERKDDHEKTIEARLGKIATNDMIKSVLEGLAPAFWWKVEKFLQKRYPGGMSGYYDVVRMLGKEARENKSKIGNLTQGIG